MTRTRVRPGRLGAVVAGALLAVVIAGRAGGSDGGSGAHGRPPATHLVERGDTLWEIARGRVGPAGDPRPLVEAMREANGLNGAEIQAGRLLVIPAAP